MSSRSWKKVILGIIFLALSLFYTILFFQRANFNDMTIFNIVHLKSLANIFSSPINFDYWNHTGSMINVFSPWLTILPGWLFVKINILYGYGFYFLLITFLTFISSYYFMNKFSKDTLESILFSVIYTFSFNRFMLVFQNQRLENYLVLIFLPMIYYGAFQFYQNKGWQNLTWGLILIGWTAPYMALAVVATLIPLFIMMLFLRKSHQWKYWGQLLVNTLKVVFFSLVATVGFIGPLLFEQLPTKLIQTPIKRFNYVNWFNGLGFTMIQKYLLLGISVLSLLLLAMVFFKSSFSYKVIMLEIVPLVCLLIVPLQIQYFDISRIIPAFQSILDLFIAIILSRIVILVFQEVPSIWKLAVIILSIVGLSSVIYVKTNQIQATQTLVNSSNVDYSKFVWNYHDQATKGQNKFLANNRSAQVSFYTHANDYWIQYYNPQSVELDLPVQLYSGNKVELNNEPVKIKVSKRNTIQLRTNPGKNIIEIHAQYNWVAIISLLFSLIGFIVLGYCSLDRKTFKWKKLSENG